jgi:RHS repeat-associated protein
MRRSRAFIGSPPEWELWSNLRFPCGNVNGISDGFHTYSYDADGNLTQVDGGATARYLYNALNQRIRTEVGGTVREFVFHLNGQRVSVWDGTSGQLLQAEAYWQGSPFEFSSSGTAHFQHFDQLGTVRVQTSYNGAVEGAYQSLAFGDGYSLVSGTDSDAYHYAMLDHDAETDTHHGWFRQYSSAQGRWMSPDPYDGSYDFSNPQSLNRYSYVLNNPLAYADPWGMNICVIIGGDTWSITAGGTTTSGSDPGTLICTSDPSGGGNSGIGARKILPNKAPNNLPMPSKFKLTIPGTNYCGPGGSGTPTNQTDAACAAHDRCYQNAGATFRNNIPFWPTSAQQRAAMQACDANLCTTLNNNYSPTSAEAGQATLVETYFGCSGGYSLR